jgi:hypothetical protein
LFAAFVKARRGIAAITRVSRSQPCHGMVVKSVTAIAEIVGVTQPWLAQTIWLWLLLQLRSVLAEETSDAGY